MTHVYSTKEAIKEASFQSLDVSYVNQEGILSSKVFEIMWPSSGFLVHVAFQRYPWPRLQRSGAYRLFQHLSYKKFPLQFASKVFNCLKNIRRIIRNKKLATQKSICNFYNYFTTIFYSSLLCVSVKSYLEQISYVLLMIKIHAKFEWSLSIFLNIIR